MKKIGIFLITVCCLVLLALVSYKVKAENNNPEVEGVLNKEIAKGTGEYDCYKGIEINDAKDGTISLDKLTIVIVDLKNNLIIDSINLSNDGLYRIEYEIKDSDNNLTKKSMLLKVGSGINMATQNPYFTGIGTYKTEKQNGFFNVLKGVKAFDYLGNDITSNITYQITSILNNKVVNSIDLSKTDKYLVTYTVIDSNMQKTLKERQIIVGNISQFVTSFLGLKGIGYVYDENNINDYELIWNDEFNSNGTPDNSKWNYDLGTGVDGWGNWELQYYTSNSNNAKVEDGNLVITALKESYQGMNYTSAKVTSRDRFSFKYGMVEIKAKLPKGIGTWPAIWMMPKEYQYGEWPNCGELDIMEHVGYEQNKVIGTVHTGAFNGTNGLQKGGYSYIYDVSEEYHVYKVEWLPDVIKYYIDDNFYFEYRPSNYSTNPKNDIWPFDKEFYFNFNIAVGGVFGGKRGVDDSIWPQSMLIDYVRVYQSDTILNLKQLP